ncbi:hypothetical protein AL538_17425 [Vibrio harveyi]|uniref:Acetyltransferase n=1 Tax=Vibrio harveyi TaxID=669 RepID=A0ABN4L5G8_VIBHA|nr:hypothetical protein [Vibrio harveyi]AMF99510.1 hypothetical protein AL538_17425 [Vibrio harveyi]
MEIIVRPTTVEDAAALVEIYSQPKAQRETLQLPKPSVAMWVERLSKIPAGVYSYVAEIEGEFVDASFRDGEFINTYSMARIKKPKN